MDAHLLIKIANYLFNPSDYLYPCEWKTLQSLACTCRVLSCYLKGVKDYPYVENSAWPEWKPNLGPIPIPNPFFFMDYRTLYPTQMVLPISVNFMDFQEVVVDRVERQPKPLKQPKPVKSAKPVKINRLPTKMKNVKQRKWR